MLTIRAPQDIYHAGGRIKNGTFEGRWHFSFDEYYDPAFTSFGTLRVFNDDTLAPGAVWPLHPHHDIEVVTYCAQGEFRHADQNGAGGILKKGWVQHTTVGSGMLHSEINNRPDEPLRFIQMWFLPSAKGLPPSVEQKSVEVAQRTNTFLPLVSNKDKDALPIRSEAKIYSSFIQKGHKINKAIENNIGVYLYVLEGGPVEVNDLSIPALGAVEIMGEPFIEVAAKEDAELLMVETLLR